MEGVVLEWVECVNGGIWEWVWGLKGGRMRGGGEWRGEELEEIEWEWVGGVGGIGDEMKEGGWGRVMGKGYVRLRVED